MKENTEQDWMERAKQGEPAVIAELYRRYWRAARATAYGVTGDLNLAEDAASEAFYAALDGLQDLKGTQRFGKTNVNTKIYFFTNFVQWM